MHSPHGQKYVDSHTFHWWWRLHEAILMTCFILCCVCWQRSYRWFRVAVELETVHVDPNKQPFRFWWRCGLESLYLHHCWLLISLWAAVPVHPWDVGLGWGLCELPHQTVKTFLHWAASTKFNWGNVGVLHFCRFTYQFYVATLLCLYSGSVYAQ